MIARDTTRIVTTRTTAHYHKTYPNDQGPNRVGGKCLARSALPEWGEDS